jgi:biotin carboxylase
VPVPSTLFPDGPDDEELRRAGRSLGYPLVIKPRHSSGSRGIRVVRSEAELLRSYPETHSSYPNPILQQYIEPGPRYDVCLLMDGQGDVKAEFAQKELRHFPLDRGPSTLQESVLAPRLVEQAKALLRSLPWHGVAELEFMVDPRDGVPKLMEINPRFWNSVQLAVFAGVDFPWLLYRMAMGEELAPVREYEVGVRCKWLLPGDLLHFAANRDRFRMDPPVWAGKSYNVRDDICSKSDPGPMLGFGAACLRYCMSRNMWKMLLGR